MSLHTESQLPLNICYTSQNYSSMTIFLHFTYYCQMKLYTKFRQCSKLRYRPTIPKIKTCARSHLINQSRVTISTGCAYIINWNKHAKF